VNDTQLSQDTTYNGWRNYQTWNVQLWIANDEGLYRRAVEFVNGAPGERCDKDAGVYERFAQYVLREDLGMVETPDEVAFNDSGLDLDALDGFMKELA